jgi:hypothetical protein
MFNIRRRWAYRFVPLCSDSGAKRIIEPEGVLLVRHDVAYNFHEGFVAA